MWGCTPKPKLDNGIGDVGDMNTSEVIGGYTVIHKSQYKKYLDTLQVIDYDGGGRREYRLSDGQWYNRILVERGLLNKNEEEKYLELLKSKN
jgi:hypothetical protein